MGLPTRMREGRRDMITVSLAGWLMIGLFVDGWAHVNLTELETFFTPWHGLFYSGFVAVAGWILWNVTAHRTAARPIPAGYTTALAGLGVFAIGGVGDGAWHTFFGIETSVDALFSPTHLLLLAGMTLVITTPLRSLAGRRQGEVGFAEFAPAALALTEFVALYQFFFLYASGLNSGAPAFVWEPNGDDLVMVFGVLSILLTTAIVFGPMTWAYRQWNMPTGTFTLVLGTLGVLMQGLEEFSQPREIVVPLAAGLGIDLLARTLRPADGVWRSRALAAGGPALLWTVHLVVFDIVGSIGWPLEVWTGTVLWAALVGLGLSLLTTPAVVPAPRDEPQLVAR